MMHEYDQNLIWLSANSLFIQIEQEISIQKVLKVKKWKGANKNAFRLRFLLDSETLKNYVVKLYIYTLTSTLLIIKQQDYRIEKSSAIKISLKIARAVFRPEVNTWIR